MELRSHWWSDLSTREFAALDMSNMVAILPIGATEQHGPHLPVGVDATINHGIVSRAAEKMAPSFPALVLPVQAIGKSDEHLAFPGTIGLSYSTLAKVWTEIGEAVHRAGCKRIIMINSHGGNRAVMEIVARELRVKLGMLAVATHWSKIIERDDLFSSAELAHGIHGGEVETSVMLALRPDLVDMEHAQNFETLSMEMAKTNSYLNPLGPAALAWQAQDINPFGAAGDASEADGDRGQICVERAADALIKLAGEVSSFPLERLQKKTAFSS